MSAAVEVRSVTKRFGRSAAVDTLSLEVERGEFLTLLGPSGCGKTTLLRMIAGFETPDAGQVLIGGEDVTDLPPYRRNVNQVFQSYALFPHLTVRDNIAFGLKMQGVSRTETSERVAEAVALVSLEGMEQRKPHQLSGGQRQRVALARALAPRPAVLLLDEPLSALDAQLRHAMQLELKRLQRRLGTTFIFVTHDQEEALAMSDRIALINRGRIEQLGRAQEIYHGPHTRFAAEFIGQANLVRAEFLEVVGAQVRVRLLDGLILTIAAGRWPAGAREATVAIRPEKIHVGRERLEGSLCFRARIEEEVFQGALDRLVVATEFGPKLTVVDANESALQEALREGEEIWCALHADDLVVLRD
jgi:spermidine/putrescine transport system ATP-binding protein